LRRSNTKPGLSGPLVTLLRKKSGRGRVPAGRHL